MRFQVLLDEFISSVARDKAAAELEVEKENAKRRITGSLDGITKSLTAFQSPENLREKMDDLYQQLDRDGSGGLNFEEVSLPLPSPLSLRRSSISLLSLDLIVSLTVCWQFKDGFKNLRGISSIHMTCDDFDQLTENGMLLTDGQFNSAQFRDMMKGVCVCQC